MDDPMKYENTIDTFGEYGRYQNSVQNIFKQWLFILIFLKHKPMENAGFFEDTSRQPWH